MIAPPDLSQELRPIFEYEISRKNAIERIDSPAGSKCPLAIIFSEPLDIQNFVYTLGRPNGVKIWENRDRHYPLEKGGVCERTGQAIAGPIGNR